MELLQEFWFFITHLNITLPAFIGEHGNLVYALLFAITRRRCALSASIRPRRIPPVASAPGARAAGRRGS